MFTVLQVDWSVTYLSQTQHSSASVSSHWARIGSRLKWDSGLPYDPLFWGSHCRVGGFRGHPLFMVRSRAQKGKPSSEACLKPQLASHPLPSCWSDRSRWIAMVLRWEGICFPTVGRHCKVTQYSREWRNGAAIKITTWTNLVTSSVIPDDKISTPQMDIRSHLD